MMDFNAEEGWIKMAMEIDRIQSESIQYMFRRDQNKKEIEKIIRNQHNRKVRR